MATYNTRIKKRNASNTGWDSILPITTAENVLINEQGDTVIPLATTANATYYVNASTGSDENDGSASDKAFKTINKALNQIPQIVNHIITINIANGTYAEAIVLQGKLGFGGISLAPSTDVILSGYASSILSSVGKTAIGIKNCSCGISLYGNNPIKIKPAGNLGSDIFTGLEVKDSISSSGVKRISINRSDITTTGAKKGVVAYGSILYLFECVISANNGIEALYGAHVHSHNNTGSNDGTALIAMRGAVISKEGTQPTGTTAEKTSTGGVIR